MADERQIDLVLRARNITQAAFAEVNKVIAELEDKTKKAGDSAKASGDGLLSFSASTKESFATMGLAVGLAGAAIASVTAAIVALGVRGADVADVRGSFKGLNDTIGNDSVKVLGTLRTAFAGTVSDFDLMKMSNVALSAGLKASSTDFGLLGDSARVLADRGLGSANEAFETLSKAMATGKLKAAELLIGNIDAGQAYADYGLQIGKAAGALSEAEKITATSIAITERLKDSVIAGGLAQFDFADALDASKVMLGNFKDALAEAIATSPVVNAMLGSFKVGLESAFGVDQQAMVQSLTGYVNKFAIFLVDVSEIAVGSARIIGNAFFGLQAAFNTVMGFLTSMGAGFVDLQITVAEAARALTMPGLRGPVDANIAQLKELRAYVGAVSESFTKSADDALLSAGDWNAGLDTVQSGLGAMRAEMVKAMTATDALAGSTDAQAGATDGLATATDAATEAIIIYGDAVITAAEPVVEVVEKQIDKVRELEMSARGMGKAYVDAFDAAAAAAADLLEEQKKLREEERKRQLESRQLGGSFEITRENFAPTARGLGQDAGLIETLLHKGYSFQQAMLWANHPDWAPPEHPGPRVPGFAMGVTNFAGGWAWVGERGPELLNLPGGSSVIPQGGAMQATWLAEMRALFDRLNSEQAALWLAAGGVITKEQEAITERMRPMMEMFLGSVDTQTNAQKALADINRGLGTSFTDLSAAVAAAVKGLTALDYPFDVIRRHLESLGIARGRFPGFADGVENFAGGLARVHAGELLVNLPRGTDVIPAGRAGGTVVNNYHVTVHVGAALSSKQELARYVQEAMVDLARANGQRFGVRR